MKTRLFVVVFLILVLVILNGCGNKRKNFILTEFESNISAQNEKTEINGVFHYKNEDCILFTVTAPEELKNITFSFNGKETIVSSTDMSVSMENISFGEDLFSPLFECICLLSSSENIISKEGTDEILMSGKRGEFKVKVDSAEEKILSIENMDNIYKFR